MNSPLTPASFLSMVKTARRIRQKGYWIEVKVADENDDEITLECRVDIDEEHDPYCTGDSPTSYVVEIYEVICGNDDYDNAEAYTDEINKAAIRFYKG